MSEPTPEDVRLLWTDLSRIYDSRTIHKGSSEEMRYAAEVLGSLEIIDPDAFLNRFSTTIGRRIYIPFEIGNPDSRPLWDQIETCVHEHQHIATMNRMGHGRYTTLYVGSRSERSLIEVECYRSAIELEHWHTGHVDAATPHRLAEKLRNYAVRPEDVEMARLALVAAARSITRRGYRTEAALDAMRWMNEHAVHLRYL